VTGAQQLTEQVRQASKAEGKAEAVLDVLASRRLVVSEAQRARVLGTSDIATLDRWLKKAGVADSAEDVFG
jgi:hypothetical protein